MTSTSVTAANYKSCRLNANTQVGRISGWKTAPDFQFAPRKSIPPWGRVAQTQIV